MSRFLELTFFRFTELFRRKRRYTKALAPVAALVDDLDKVIRTQRAYAQRLERMGLFQEADRAHDEKAAAAVVAQRIVAMTK